MTVDTQSRRVHTPPTSGQSNPHLTNPGPRVGAARASCSVSGGIYWSNEHDTP